MRLLPAPALGPLRVARPMRGKDALTCVCTAAEHVAIAR